jgi:hypothetical protein
MVLCGDGIRGRMSFLGWSSLCRLLYVEYRAVQAIIWRYAMS